VTVRIRPGDGDVTLPIAVRMPSVRIGVTAPTSRFAELESAAG